MPELTISLLGTPEISLDGHRVTFDSSKAVALLAYLTVTGTGHRRAEMAALLWPESDQRRARGALRYTLSLLRKGLNEEWLDFDRQQIDLRRGPHLRLDVTEFQQRLIQSQTHNHPPDQICAACAEALTEAVRLYRGDFLTGFSLRDSPAFDEWQFFQTENLRRDFGLALERLTHYHAAQAEVETAIIYARRWLNLDPHHEPIYRELMGLYAAAGQWAAATRQYEACIQMLDEEFGVPAAAETTGLYERLRQARAIRGRMIPDKSPGFAETLTLPVAVSPPNNLPRHLTAFVGREQELTEMARLLEDNEIRLVNIVGPGGIGKTRLALEAAAAGQAAFVNGVYFVALASVNTVHTIVPTMAQAIGFSFFEGREPETQLLDYLSGRQMLLLLDNVEHLLRDSAVSLLALLTTMLHAAPQLKILTTSRVRLNLQVEYVYPVQGLAHPVDKLVEGTVFGEETLLSTSRYPALALFQQRARQVQPSLTRAGLNDVARICRLTEGMPLAIELAAAMTSVLDLPAIAGEIERNLDVLSTDRPDVHRRHRSMRAVFDSSWQSLTLTEQAMFARLSVFNGSFTREAATQVSQATLDNLAALVNKSLLRHQPSGHYEIHELMRQYAAERLAATPVEQDIAQQCHSEYYQQFLSQTIAYWHTHYQPQSMTAIALEINNLRGAWQWALAQQELTVVWSYIKNLWPFYKTRGRYSEAVEMFTQTLQLMRTGGFEVSPTRQAEGERLLGEAYFGLGHSDTSQDHLYRALRLVDQPMPTTKVRLFSGLCVNILSHLKRRLPAIPGKTYSDQEKQSFLIAAKIYDRLSYIDYVTGRSIPFATIRSLNLAEMADPSSILAIAYANVSALFGILSRRRWADYYAKLARKIIESLPDVPARAAIALRFSIYNGALGQWEQAIAEGQRALQLYQRVENRRNWGDCLAILGVIALLQGHFRQCITYGAALQTVSNGNHNVEHQAWAVCGQALSLLHLGQTIEAFTLATEFVPHIDQPVRSTVHARSAIYSVIAAAHLRQGNKILAVQAADVAVDLLQQNAVSLNIGSILFYSQVAEVYLTLWEQASSSADAVDQINHRHCQTQAQQICQNLYRRAWLFKTRRPFAYLYQGYYDWLAGRRHRAQRLWLRSLANAQRLKFPYIEGAAHYQIGRHLPLDDLQRQVHLNRAVEIFQRLETAFYLTQAQAALAEVK